LWQRRRDDASSFYLKQLLKKISGRGDVFNYLRGKKRGDVPIVFRTPKTASLSHRKGKKLLRQQRKGRETQKKSSAR